MFGWVHGDSWFTGEQLCKSNGLEMHKCRAFEWPTRNQHEQNAVSGTSFDFLDTRDGIDAAELGQSQDAVP